MEEQLKILNQTKYKEFEALDNLIIFLNNFFSEDYLFPLIFNEETLFLESDFNSRAFMKEYLTKLQKFSSFEKSHNYNLFEGHINYLGLTEQIPNTKMFEANVNVKTIIHPNVPIQRYNLSLFFGMNTIASKPEYYARVNKTKSIIDILSENGV